MCKIKIRVSVIIDGLYIKFIHKRVNRVKLRVSRVVLRSLPHYYQQNHNNL